MRLAQRLNTPSRDPSVSAGLNEHELRQRLTAAVERFDHHQREAQDLGRLNKTVESLAQFGLASDAAREAESIADQITALGNATTTSTAGSNWMVEK